MQGVALVQAIIEILVAGITGIATGIGQGLSSLVTSVFFVTEGSTTTMSAFAVLIVAFGGIALAVGLSRKVVSWLASLGGSRM